ncbi:MAG: NPCBM/NEW2 domain-containing protein [Chitinophagaceae bacterium]|nr:NPCBM/NEW2 domain-containing protein [Chitinophagaceae bacterium]
MTATRFLSHSVLLVAIFFCSVLCVNAQGTDTLWLQKIDLTRFTQDWSLTPRAYLAIQENPLKLAGKPFKNGLASGTEAHLRFDLNRKAQRLYALFGLDDSSDKTSSVFISALADNKEIFRSPVMKRGAKPVEINLDLKGVKQLWLVIDDNGKGVYNDKADLVNAFIAYEGSAPEVFNFNYINKRHILTPAASPDPKINGAKVFGVRPGHPFMYTIAATGKRPMSFAVENLPAGLSVDNKTGIITGVVADKGETVVKLKATNELGTATRDLKIVVGDRIALTPPMGWNGYNRYGDSINDAIVRSSVDAMVSSGLINHGWTYINIDDGWSVKLGTNNPLISGEPRDLNGMINANKKFPDMKALCDYIHSKGFKAGIYSSPSTVTCSGYTASYGFEDEDAQRWADWGFDYLKHDFCSYNKISNSESLATLQKPYKVMRNALNKVKRDIVLSYSQYGMGDVWKWGDSLGGNSWRTTPDLIDKWNSNGNGLEEIGFNQAGLEKYAGPGHWNDPDMLVLGWVGWGEWQYPSRLTADEQYTQMSLWSLLSAPLLIGCDVIALDEFTKNLFTNDEVIDINQDPLGKQAARVYQKDGLEIWMKEMEDGTRAVGLFNRNTTAATIKATWNVLQLNGKQTVRDTWRQKNEGVFNNSFSAVVPAHGVKLITIRKAK